MIPVLNLADIWKGVSKKILTFAFGTQVLFALVVGGIALFISQIPEIWESINIMGFVEDWQISETIHVGWLDGELFPFVGYVLALDRFAAMWNMILEVFAGMAQIFTLFATSGVVVFAAVWAFKALRRIMEDWLQL